MDDSISSHQRQPINKKEEKASRRRLEEDNGEDV